MKAHARFEAGARGWTVRQNDPPFTVHGPPERAHLVGSAAGPLGGDHLELALAVDAGATLHLRSVAAQLVLPGRTGERSRLDVTASAAPGSTLHWEPEQTVLVAGCRHDALAEIRLADDARLWWREELVLGRHQEAPGSVVATTRIERAGAVLLHHELALGPEAGPGWDGPGGLGTHRAVGSLVVVDPQRWADGPPDPEPLGEQGALLPLDGPGVLVLVVGTPPEVRAVLAQAARALRHEGVG